MKMPAKLRAVGYGRVSTADQTVNLQIDEITAYVKNRGWNLEKLFTETASGTGTQKRPVWKQVMSDAASRSFDILVVWRLDRWGRSLQDVISSIQALESYGIMFCSIRDGVDLSNESSSSRLLLHLVSAFSQFERQLICERVRSGLAAAKSRGVRLGRPRRIPEAEVLRLRGLGHSLSAIAAELRTTKGGVSKTLKRSRLQIPESIGDLNGICRGDNITV